MTAWLLCYDQDAALVGYVADYAELTWLEELEGVGQGSVTVEADSAETVILDASERVEVHTEDGIVGAFLIREESSDTETATYSGPGPIGILNEAMCYPPAFAANSYDAEPTERRFDFTDTYMDDSRMDGTVVDQGTQEDPTPLTAWIFHPEAWILPSAYWLWVDHTTDVPAGRVYLRCYFSTSTDFEAWLHCAADDQADVYLDGVLLARMTGADSWRATTEVFFILYAGTHALTAVCENLERPGENPGGFIAAIMGDSGSVSPDPDAVIVKTDPDQTIAEPWKGEGYTATPGMTPGETLRRGVDDAQTRGGLIGVTYDFDWDHDSYVNAWLVSPAITMRPTDSLTSLVERLREHEVEVWMTHEMLLRAAPRRGEDKEGAVRLSLGSELTSVRHSRPRRRGNVLLVRTQSEDWEEHEDDDSVTAVGRREDSLELGSVDDHVSATKPVRAAFERNARGRVESRLEHAETARTRPMVDYTVGDRVTVPAWTQDREVEGRVIRVAGRATGESSGIRWETTAEWLS